MYLVKLKGTYLLFLFCLTFLSVTGADLNNNQTALEEANTLYVNGSYSGAIDAYKVLIEDGIVVPELYYNLGNAYFRNNEVGLCILNYEKALKQDPSFKDAKYNLSIAQEKAGINNSVLPDLFFIAWGKKLLAWFSVQQWMWLTVITVWLACLCFALSTFSSIRIKKSLLRTGSAFLLFVAITCSIFAFVRHTHLSQSNYAIILNKKVKVKSAPDEEAAAQFSLTEGAKVEILDDLEGWKKIGVNEDQVGWVSEEEMDKI